MGTNFESEIPPNFIEISIVMSRAIPLVDLNKFVSGNETERKDFVNELGHAFQEFGFVGVVNHGIPKELVARFYGESKAFFSLPLEVDSSSRARFTSSKRSKPACPRRATL